MPSSRPRAGVLPVVIAVVAVGGAAGAVCRYLLTEVFPGPADSFPWLVLGINVVGSGLLAALPALAPVHRHPLLPPLLGTGFLGGFTTMSTYSEQTRALLAGGHRVTAALYVLGTLSAALLAVSLVDRLTATPERAELDDADGDL